MHRISALLVSSFLLVAISVACGDDDPAANGGTTTTGDGGPGTVNPASCDPAGCGSGKCDAVLGCVECAADGDCATRNGAPFCIRGRCEACRTNTDCGVAAPVCYPGDNRCHRACNPDAGGGGGPGPGGGGGNRCAGAARLCDSATGACVGCQAATDCRPEAPLCEPTTKSCVTCLTNTDCPAATPKCDPQNFRCVTCLVNADCPAGQACNDENRCFPRCTDDTGCATDPQRKKCNVTTGRCVSCLTNTECTGTPATPLCATGRNNRCVQCNVDGDCGDAGGRCRLNTCLECINDNDCPGQDGNCDNGRCRR